MRLATTAASIERASTTAGTSASQYSYFGSRVGLVRARLRRGGGIAAEVAGAKANIGNGKAKAACCKTEKDITHGDGAFAMKKPLALNREAATPQEDGPNLGKWYCSTVARLFSPSPPAMNTVRFLCEESDAVKRQPANRLNRMQKILLEI